MSTIVYQPKALRQLRKIRNNVPIRAAIDDLVNMPACNNVRRLVNHQYTYRLRVGNYRVFFEFDGIAHIVLIEEVKKRDDNTY